MPYIKSLKIPKTLFHCTKKEDLNSIAISKTIYPSDGLECWFCLSLEDMLTYIQLTLMNEGQKYIASDFTIKEYGPFHADDYVILELKPRYTKDNWYYYICDDSQSLSFEQMQMQNKLEKIKICYKGILEFKNGGKVCELKNLIKGD